MAAFRNVGGTADEPEMEAAGHFWFSRAAVACGQPQEAQPALRRAARLDETFYGLLAQERLGIRPRSDATANRAAAERVAALPNVRLASLLVGVGETSLADEVLRHQARVGSQADHGALVEVARSLSLPETQLYLAHNAPQGARPHREARFPTPSWAPADGWRVNPALILAHTLQESQFRSRAVSPAGAVGLMQVRRGTGNDMGLRQMGGDLTNPAINLALGQNYIEHLRDSPATAGLLPRVIAAYNAGPTPVARWASEVRDNGDPLLFIESIPYWETRAYVGTVLRNLWVYERQLGTPTNSLTTLAQGQWPRVPTVSGDNRRRLTQNEGQRAR
jgi:soluble lytic murein transglycosylase-like protein